jgi:2-polyprenyl-3-methyl-5-hydroxy-6-metoxy-1,4-benzoquinol methylase
VTGLDIDANALRRAQEKFGIDTKQVDLNGEWGIPVRTYDAVVAAEVLEHLYYPNVVIQKVADVLTPEGLFVGTVPNAFSLRHRLRYIFKQKRGTPLEDPTHINHFTVRELHSMLRERFEEVAIFGYGRLGWLAKIFPQSFAFGLMWVARYPQQ